MKHLTQTDKRKILQWFREGFGSEDMAVMIARVRVGDDPDEIKKITGLLIGPIRAFRKRYCNETAIQKS